MENFQSKLLAFSTPLADTAEMFDPMKWLKFVSEGAQCSVNFHAWGFRSRLLGGSYDGIFPADVDTNKTWYESRSNPRVHYIGWHMHKYDFRQGSGGFANGFRYLIRNLWQQVQSIDQPTTVPNEKLFTAFEISRYAFQRINHADDLVIMQDGQVLRDVIEIISGGANCMLDSSRWRYLSGRNYNFLTPRRTLSAATIFFTWGNQSRDARTVWNEEFWITSKQFTLDEYMALRNIMLHPVLEWQGFQYHFFESCLNDWSAISDAIVKVFDELLPLMVSSHCGDKNAHRHLSKDWTPKTTYTRPQRRVVSPSSPAEEKYLMSMKSKNLWNAYPH